MDKSNVRVTTLEQYTAEAEAIFGSDKMNWKFVCPACGYVASVKEYQEAGAPEGAVGFLCVGRWKGAKRRAFGDTGDGPCDYAGGGLIGINPVHIEGHGYYFEFAK
ncbi:MAG: hypothetical protein JW908_00685 [Anaerolineales bacterium]|nr:hypothetical protein [Anaerolineales bacterium]